MPRFVFDSVVDVAPEFLFAWHEQRGALHRLLPPWMRTRVKRYDGLVEGGRLVLQFGAGPLRLPFVSEIRNVEQGRRFTDVQVRGPFRSWRHVHEFLSVGDGTSQLVDSVDVAYPRPARLVSPLQYRIKREIERSFAYRHTTMRNDLVRIRQYTYTQPLRIAVSGTSGMIGAALAHFLDAAGHEVFRMVRERPDHERHILFDYRQQTVDATALEGMDAVVHLAAEPMAALRWSAEKRMRIHASRVRSTEYLARTLARLERKPNVFITPSLVGIYGDRPGERLTEDSAPGEQGFLTVLGRDWEAAARPAEEAGIRTVQLRFGLVLSPQNPIIRLVLEPMRVGLGARVRARDTDLSWISIDDALYAIYHILNTRSIRGPVNVVSSIPATRRIFIESMARTLSNKIRIAVPARSVRFLMGEVADEVIFKNQRAVPEKLLQSGFTFAFASLQDAMRQQFGV